MISVEKYFEVFNKNNINFFAGIPDSSLKNFVSYVADNIEKKNHIIGSNEGTCIAIATGYNLATNKIPVVYLQNSGLGNTVNPLMSLTDEAVYGIPILLLIGWRGEPNKKDEPQHIKQGLITLDMLDSMKIPYEVINENESDAILKTERIIKKIKNTRIPHAIVAKKGIFNSYKLQSTPRLSFEMSREDAMKKIVTLLDDKDVIVSTTGKLSRELFEYRESLNMGHEKDFLTVGSMGHASSIAFGIALEKPERNIYCFDGDGAVLMHTGALSNIGNSNLANFKHIIFNNGAHESVGGQETLGFSVDFPAIAKASGYSKVYSVDSVEKLITIFNEFKNNECTSLLEIKVGINTRSNLGRPTTTPFENKIAFMSNLNS